MSQGKVSAIEPQKKPEPARQLEQEPARQPERGPVQQVAPQVAYRRVQGNGGGVRAADLLALQRTVGNRALQRIVAQRDFMKDEQPSTLMRNGSGVKVKPSVTMGAANNTYGQEGKRAKDAVIAYHFTSNVSSIPLRISRKPGSAQFQEGQMVAIKIANCNMATELGSSQLAAALKKGDLLKLGALHVQGGGKVFWATVVKSRDEKYVGRLGVVSTIWITPTTVQAGNQPTGTQEQKQTPPATSTGVDKEAPLQDEDASVSRKISIPSEEFIFNYIDYNIASADYWSTPYATQDPKYREFWVNYTDGRKLKFSLDEIPIRYALVQKPGYISVRSAISPQKYFKRGGFIYPDHYGEGSVPRLIDIATTIAYNHRQREQFLEIASLTFQFSINLAQLAGGLATPGGLPRGPRAGPRLPFSKGRGVPKSQAPVEPVTQPRGSGRAPSKTSVPKTGTPGNRAASVEAASKRAAKRPPTSQLPASQQTIRDSLLHEHPGLNPTVATEAAKSGAKAMGSGGKGADVVLINGGGREVSVHSGAFTSEGIGSHLQAEAAQVNTTEIYLQINSTGATKAELLQMISRLRNAYPELRGILVKIFGSDGSIWWSGAFSGPL